MALDTRTRSSIYQKLVPLLGADDANALMSELPSTEDDELVKRSFLRAEVADLRGDFAGLRGEFTDVRGELADLRAETRSELAEVRGEARGEFAKVRAELAALETRLTVRMGAGAAGLATLMVVLKLFG